MCLRTLLLARTCPVFFFCTYPVFATPRVPPPLCRDCYRQEDHRCVYFTRYLHDLSPPPSSLVPPPQVKNSWGPDWGMDGYILLKREAAQEGGECGILEQASYPVLV